MNRKQVLSTGSGPTLDFIKELDVPGSSDGKESACNAEDLNLTPGLGRSPGEGRSNPLQYPCLENSWWATVHGVTKS